MKKLTLPPPPSGDKNRRHPFRPLPYLSRSVPTVYVLVVKSFHQRDTLPSLRFSTRSSFTLALRVTANIIFLSFNRSSKAFVKNSDPVKRTF